MFRTIGCVFVIGASAGFAASADPIAVNEVDVQVDLDAAEYNALDYWPQIESDLKAAIAERAATLPGQEPYDVSVTVESISLNGSGLLTGEGEFNHIDGWIRAYPTGNPAAATAWPIALVASTEAPTFIGPDVILIPPAESEFYVALIDAFASEAAAILGNIDSDDVVPGSSAESSAPSLDAGEAGAGTEVEGDAGAGSATEGGADADTNGTAGADADSTAQTGAGTAAGTGATDADGAEADTSGTAGADAESSTQTGAGTAAGTAATDAGVEAEAESTSGTGTESGGDTASGLNAAPASDGN